LVTCEGGQLLREWKTYVNPEDYFDGINMSVHGISESLVKDAPKFPELVDTLRSHLEGRIVVCHTHFDRVALHQAAQKHGLEAPKCEWLDSARVARRAWNECAWSGYGLYNVCKLIGYEFKHHDALEDAKAAAHIMLAAMEQSGL
jgi:DNA polymerase III subunit epsilon